MRKSILHILFLSNCIIFLNVNRIVGQCLIPDIEFPDTVCLGEIIVINNNTAGLNTYNWDFCAGDLKKDPSLGLKMSAGAIINEPDGMVVTKVGDNWVGMVANYGNSDLVRLDFGKSLKNIPTIISLGNPGNVFSNPRAIDIIKADSSWYGLVANGGNTIVKLEFDSTLSNILSAGILSSSSGLSTPDNIDIAYSNDSVFAFIGNVSSDSITRLSFGSSINNNPVFSTIYTGSQRTTGIRIVQDCDNWYGFIIDNGNYDLIKLNFGKSLSNKPTIVNLGGMGFLNKPRGLDVVEENGMWYVFVVNNVTGEIIKLKFGVDLSNNQPDSSNLGNIGTMTSVEDLLIVSDSSKWYMFLTDYGADKVVRLDFSDSCNVDFPVTTGFSPGNNRYLKEGLYYVSVNVSNGDTGYTTIVDSVIVKRGPLSKFSASEDACFGDTISFIDSSTVDIGNITDWLWYFGNGDSSNLQNPKYYFQSLGNYNVKLTVLSDSSECSSVSSKELIVINEPVADFNVVDGCVIDSLTFIDQTNPDTLINTWIWDFGDGKNSIVQNSTHLYIDTGQFQVIFITGVQNCTDTILSTITFYPKPIANFDANYFCYKDTALFTDSSSIYLFVQTPISEWNWSFGDSDSDTLQYPKHVYGDSGNYQVTLIVTSSKNCSDTITKSIDIIKTQAKFLVKEKICAGFPIQFTDTSTVNADSLTNWIWSIDSLDSAFIQSPSYIFIDSGTYNIFLKINSFNNCTHDTVIPIYVNLGPSVGFVADTVCTDNAMSFNDNSSTNLSDTLIFWQWDFGDSSILDSSQNPNHTYSNGGKYVVSLLIGTTKGCYGIITDSVVSKPNPIAAFNYQNTCVDSDVFFSDSSSIIRVINDSIISWQWFFGDGKSSILQNPKNSYNTNTTYNILLVAESNNNCRDSLVKPVTIYQLPVIDYNNTEVCESDTTSFNSSSASYSLYWNFGDSISGNSNKSTELNPYHFYKNAGNYFVNLIGVSTENCTTKVSKTITVNYIPKAAFIYQDYCENYPGQFVDTSSVDQSQILVWNWDYGDGSKVDSAQSPNHSFSDTGKYKVRLLVFSEKGCSSSTVNEVQVFQLPNPQFGFDPEFGIPPLPVNFINNTKDSASFNWYFGDGDTSFQVNPSNTYIDTGEYVIMLIATNEFGCVDTMLDSIRVKKPILDLIINELQLNEVAGYLEAIVTFTNIGNRDIESIKFDLEYVGKSIIQEEWQGFLLPGKGRSYPFDGITKKESIKGVEIVCVDAIVINGETDDNPENNRQCLTFNKPLDALLPIYNQNNKTVILQVILEKEQEISVYFYDVLGRLQFVQQQTCNEGYNQIQLNVAHQQAGLYIYTINNGKELVNGKVIILN